MVCATGEARSTQEVRTTSSNESKESDRLFGNTRAWKAACEWFERRALGSVPKILLLRGPSGVGKTTGAYALARRNGRGLVEINACDVRASNLDQAVREGCTRAAITASGETSETRAAFVLVDDLEAYSAEALKVLSTTLGDLDRITGVVCTCSVAFRLPRYLQSSDQCMIVNLSRLSIQELCQVARCDSTFRAWSTPSLMTLAAMADGDARRLRNLLSLEKLGTVRPGEADEDRDLCAVTAATTIPSTVFDAVKRIVFGTSVSVEDVDRTFSVYDTPFATELVFANYVDSVVDDDLDTLSSAAELMSLGDSMRQGSIFALVNEARVVQGGVGVRGTLKSRMPKRINCPSFTRTSSRAFNRP